MKDMDRSGHKRDIVNGAQLPQFTGKKVSISGLVATGSAKALSIDVRAADNTVVPIQLRTPLDKPVEGYVEVHGTSQGKSVLADEFIIFGNQQFDVKGHSSLCNLLYTVPNLWKTNNS